MSRAFVFTGMAFLMVIPAVILAASLVSMVEHGNRATMVVMQSDKVAYTFTSLNQSFSSTAENLVEVYECDDPSGDAASIEAELKNWARYMEVNYSKLASVNISILEENISVTIDSQVYVRNSGGGGIPVNVTLPYSTEVEFRGTLGPLTLPCP